MAFTIISDKRISDYRYRGICIRKIIYSIHFIMYIEIIKTFIEDMIFNSTICLLLIELELYNVSLNVQD